MVNCQSTFGGARDHQDDEENLSAFDRMYDECAQAATTSADLEDEQEEWFDEAIYNDNPTNDFAVSLAITPRNQPRQSNEPAGPDASNRKCHEFFLYLYFFFSCD